VADQPFGTVLNVELTSGERLVGRFTRLEPTALVVETYNGGRRMRRIRVKKV
jgi:hypothetical protein